MKLIKLFSSAGASGHVFLFKTGKSKDMGLAYSGFIGPTTTVAVVPTMPRIVNFAINALTKDSQDVVVEGSVTVTLTPAKVVSRMDFTVDPTSGSYLSQWEPVLNAKIVERVLRAVLGAVKDMTVEAATKSQPEVEQAVTDYLISHSLEEDGVTVNSCSVPNIEPSDEDVAETIGSKERQALITESDKAMHARRLAGVKNDRAIKEYEAGTKLELEKKQGVLLDEVAKNKKKEAQADAEAITIRLKPLQDVEAGKLLGASIMEAAKSGRLSTLNITSEFLAAVGK